MAGTSPLIPVHKLEETPDGQTRSISLFGWKVSAVSTTISNASEIDEIQAKLQGLPLPEMPFGNNMLELYHELSGWRYRFKLVDALAAVRMGELRQGDGGVKVGYAKEWMQSRLDPGSETPMPQTSPTKEFDWTYTTKYAGHSVPENQSDLAFKPADLSDPNQVIPYDQLTRQDPILFYAEIPLFEDELHDNGSSHLTVRIRVMPTCLFVLCRFTLRVDNVLFRTFDTRLFHSFEQSPLHPPLVVRETGGWEASYKTVRQLLPNPHDLTPLTDPMFVSKTLTTLPKSVTQNPKAPGATGWSGLGTTVECCSLSPVTS